jgi:hypothetical protein
MSNFLAWLGWVFTVIGGGIAVWQLIQERIRRAAREAHTSHLLATVDQLGIIRAMFSEALSKGEVFKADTDRAMIRAVAHELLAAENHIRAAIGPSAGSPRPLPGARTGKGAVV